MTRKKVLFISHVASRSGAPMLLLYLLQWIKRTNEFDFDVLVLYDGELNKEFRNVATTYTVNEILKTDGIRYKISRKIKPVSWNDEINKVVRHIGINGYDLIYGNTIVTVPWLAKFKEFFKTPVVAALHELSYVLDVMFKKDYIEPQLQQLDRIIAGSGAVAANLIRQYNLRDERIEVIHSFIKTEIRPRDRRTEIFRELGLKEDDFIIGGAGTPEWRKGTDLLVLLVATLAREHPVIPVKLIWIGGNETDPEISKLKYDAAKSGLRDKLVFVNAGETYLDYMNIFEVFLLLSREDPFPLIALEACLLEKPVIAFENAGGGAELLDSGGGFLTPYLDLGRMSDKIAELYNHPEVRKQCGAIGKKEVVDKYDATVIAPKIINVLKSFFS